MVQRKRKVFEVTPSRMSENALLASRINFVFVIGLSEKEYMSSSGFCFGVWIFPKVSLLYKLVAFLPGFGVHACALILFAEAGKICKIDYEIEAFC